MNWCLGTMMKALMKFIVTRSFLKAGFAAFPFDCLGLCVRRVFVEWLGLEPCWAESERCVACSVEQTALLERVERSDIGL